MPTLLSAGVAAILTELLVIEYIECVERCSSFVCCPSVYVLVVDYFRIIYTRVAVADVPLLYNRFLHTGYKRCSRT